MKETSDIIRELLKANNLKQVDLVKATGASKGTVSKWLSDTSSPRGQYLVKLADCLGVTPDYILTGKGEVKPSPINEVKVRQVPVLNYVQAGDWRTYFEDAIADHFEPIMGNFGEYVYGLIIEGDSMNPEFKDGDIVFIDPDIQPTAGDYVVAMLDKSDGKAVTFKKYRPRGFYEQNKEYFELVALNDDYESYDSRYINCQIIGVAVEHKRKLK